MAEEHDLPIVATNDVVFLAPDDFEAHEIRVAIHDGYTLDDPKRPKRYTEQQYFRSEEEMCDLFADIPSALENTVLIAQRCNVTLRLGQLFPPSISNWRAEHGRLFGDESQRRLGRAFGVFIPR